MILVFNTILHRPDASANDENFHCRDDTWMMWQCNDPHSAHWTMHCNSCKGTGLMMRPHPKVHESDRIGLLLDLDNGGTLTMYLGGKPCGTIAEGLTGPLFPCFGAYYKGKVVRVHGGLALPLH